MGDVIDLNAMRHGQRLFRIFIRQHGLSHFLQKSDVQATPAIPRVDPGVVSETVDLAADWIALRGQPRPNPATLALLQRDLRRLLIAQIAHRLVQQSAR